MYAPVAPEPEWIELFNAGDGPVDISGWSVSDADTSARTRLPSAVPPIGAGEFALLTRDTLALLARRALPGGALVQLSPFPSLNNAGDLVSVCDPAGTAIDRVLYTPPGAFLLTSRSASAFAAELGTMKVNEEIDALVTMGVDPVQFLVLPRLVAVLCIIPLLTVFNQLLGLIGCGLVMYTWDVPATIYLERIRNAATLTDFLGISGQ